MTAIEAVPDSQGDPLYTETTMTLNGKTGMSYLAMDGESVMPMVDPGITTEAAVSILDRVVEMLLAKAVGAAFGGEEPGTFQPFHCV